MIKFQKISTDFYNKDYSIDYYISLLYNNKL